VPGLLQITHPLVRLLDFNPLLINQRNRPSSERSCILAFRRTSGRERCKLFKNCNVLQADRKISAGGCVQESREDAYDLSTVMHRCHVAGEGSGMLEHEADVGKVFPF
jgi:hypothetical protein